MYLGRQYKYQLTILPSLTVVNSVAELHHFYAAPAPGKIFYAAPAVPAPAPTLTV
jgi:hypothetical protein